MGMYITFVSLKVFGINPYFSILVCIPLLFLIGMLIQRFTFQLVMEAPHINQLLLGLGIALFLTNLLLVVFGSDPKSIRTAFTGSRVFVGEVMISLPRLAAFGGGLIGAGVLFFFLKYTDLGKAIRASSEEREGSELVGINVKWVQLITYGLGTACAGTAGSLIMPFLVVDPNAGDTFIIIAFTIVALGGLGNMIGSLIGGIIIGLVEALGAIFLPGSSKLLGVFLIFILILLFRPSGILSSVSKWQR